MWRASLNLSPVSCHVSFGSLGYTRLQFQSKRCIFWAERVLSSPCKYGLYWNIYIFIYLLFVNTGRERRKALLWRAGGQWIYCGQLHAAHAVKLSHRSGILRDLAYFHFLKGHQCLLYNVPFKQIARIYGIRQTNSKVPTVFLYSLGQRLTVVSCPSLVSIFLVPKSASPPKATPSPTPSVGKVLKVHLVCFASRFYAKCDVS